MDVTIVQMIGRHGPDHYTIIIYTVGPTEGS